MSFTFCIGLSKKQVFGRIVSTSEGRVLEHIRRGNTVWQLVQGISAPFIECCPVVQNERGIWGYRRLREERHTPCNCPVELLNRAPSVSPEWRSLVHRFHKEHSKSPVVGEIWTLKKATVPHVTIVQTHPQLKGEYQGVPRPLKTSDLRMVIGMAFAPKCDTARQLAST